MSEGEEVAEFAGGSGQSKKGPRGVICTAPETTLLCGNNNVDVGTVI